MNQRKDVYRAALQRRTDTATPSTTRVTPLDTRYLRVVIEVDPGLPREITRWVGRPVAVLLRAGAAVMRPAGQGG
ncbi:hypothetical protein [Streptomyces sp. SID161]|uniref:hypothetical protein n=1 Tax=unclassified Streptomyces TaxID=2593676 RepID=UPI00136FC9DD|nr:hypothetical protein [Streptomyces sp. SID161]MYW47885.1 hypothetical protein [Streptomyces sp. SID161]